MNEDFAAWAFDNLPTLAVWSVAGLLGAGGLLVAWANGYRVYVVRRCPYCAATGCDPAYEARRPCKHCGGRGLWPVGFRQ